jgi:hypothetical protein
MVTPGAPPGAEARSSHFIVFMPYPGLEKKPWRVKGEMFDWERTSGLAAGLSHGELRKILHLV